MAVQGYYTRAFISGNKRANNPIMEPPPHSGEPKEHGNRRQAEATRPPNQELKATYSPDPDHKLGQSKEEVQWRQEPEDQRLLQDAKRRGGGKEPLETSSVVRPPPNQPPY